MPNLTWIKPVSLVAALLLAGCGTAPQAHPAARSASVSSIRQVALKQARLEAPVTAKAVLTFAHAAAHQLDAKASFLSMTGLRIQPDGTPDKRGQWQLSYLGDVVPTPAGQAPNPYNRYMRRIAVTVAADGTAAVAVSEEPGMPLGVQLLEAPIPGLDSSEAITIARRHAEDPFTGPVAKMVLCAQMSPKMFNRLIWKVTTTAQGGDAQVSLDASTGDLIQR